MTTINIVVETDAGDAVSITVSDPLAPAFALASAASAALIAAVDTHPRLRSEES